jgi:hypothetical protein
MIVLMFFISFPFLEPVEFSSMESCRAFQPPQLATECIVAWGV